MWLLAGNFGWYSSMALTQWVADEAAPAQDGYRLIVG
jgi:hypothetical protein